MTSPFICMKWTFWVLREFDDKSHYKMEMKCSNMSTKANVLAENSCSRKGRRRLKISRNEMISVFMSRFGADFLRIINDQKCSAAAKKSFVPFHFEIFETNSKVDNSVLMWRKWQKWKKELEKCSTVETIKYENNEAISRGWWRVFTKNLDTKISFFFIHFHLGDPRISLKK